MVEKYKIYTGALFFTLWVACCWGFVASDIIPALESATPGVMLFIDGMFLCLGLIALRTRRDWMILISLWVIILISMFLNHESFVSTLNGFRSYIGLCMCVPIVRRMLTSRYASRFMKSVDRQLFILLCLQAICIPIQFKRYGATDAVGGTFGNWATGVVSTLIYVISFYLMCRHWNPERSYWRNLWANKIYIILLFPSFLNETKISFIFLALYFPLLLTLDRKMIARLLVAMPLLIALMCGAGYFYINATDNEKALSLDYVSTYLTGGDEVQELVELSVRVQDEGLETDKIWAIDLPRFLKLTLVPEALDATKGGLLFGAGVGQFKGGTVMGRTYFSRNYNWLLRGTVPFLFYILIELGFMGVIWLLSNLLTVLCKPVSGGEHNLNIKIYIAAIWFVGLLYDQQLTTIASSFITFYLCLSGIGVKNISYGVIADRQNLD